MAGLRKSRYRDLRSPDRSPDKIFSTFGILATIAAIAATAALLAPLSAHAALSRTDLLDTASASGYGTGSYVTGSFTPPDNSLLVAVIVMEMALDNASTPTISGGGLSWTERVSDRGQAEEDQIYIYTAPVTTGASMTLTLDHGAGNVYKYMPMVVAFTGYDTSSPTGATANDNDATGGSPFNLTLSSAPAASSVVVAAALADNAGGFITTGSDFTEVYFTEDDLEWQLQVRGNSTSQTASWQTLSAAFGVTGVAVEIKEGAAAGTSALSKPPNNLGLVGYWSFNEGTSTVATDFSGNGNTGTFVNTPAWVNGKRGKALDFELGDDDYVNAGSGTTLALTAATTICAWVKPESLATGENGIVVRSPGSVDWPYAFHALDATGKLAFVWSDTGGANTEEWETTAGVITVGAWYHVCGVRNAAASDVQFYANGVNKAGSGAGDFTPSATAGSTKIGTNEAGGWDGLIDEVRIYNRALSATEIAALARTGAVRLTSNSKTLTQGSSLENGLVGLWTFDGADTGTTITDRSGSNNHGYLYNGATSSAKTIGKLGQAFNFDGVNDRVQISSNITVPSAVTFAGWVNLNALVPVSDVYDIFPMNDGDCAIRLEDDETLAFWNNGIAMSPADGKFGGAAMTVGSWRHIAVTIVNTVATTYIDGAVNGSTVDVGATFDCEGSSSLDFAGSVTGGNFFSGRLDDIRIYNRALTATEVKQLYNLGKAKIVQ